MVISINEYSDVPIYLQIRNQIVMGISSGELSAGEQLPTVRALSMEIGINTMTVSKAYQILKSEGYILTDRKNGARVRMEIDQSGHLSSRNKDELRRIVSEAKISGVKKDDFDKMIEEMWGE
ncbi:MAG: GntR family transcriptional regulator [Lachnospiraceae bacterium]|nr:GntR family transcriptional regulator [Lachnospiraceae bacterium]